MSKPHIPFARPDIGEAEIQEVVDSLRSGWLTSGPKAKQFEQDFANYIGVKHAIAVNSCTAAMHLALEAMGIGPGDKVITTVFTFTATAEVIRYMGADPVFVDVEPDTLNLSLDQVRAELKKDPSIKVIMPVHFAGLACDMQALRVIATEFNVQILDDAAHAFPASSAGEMIGSGADATAFSFYVTKTLAVGEGGMLTTNDDAIADRARIMRLHGISRDVFNRYQSSTPSWHYEVIAPGFKYNLTDLAAAIGLHQLRRADELRAKREALATRYMEAFSALPLQLPASPPGMDIHAWHLFVVQLELDRLKVDRDEVISMLSELGIGTSVHFIPLHRQPYWRDRYGLQPAHFPCAEAAYRRVISLPLYTSLAEVEIERIIDAVNSVLSGQIGN